MKEDFYARYFKHRDSWELIGEGGFAKVFKTNDSSGRPIAIKEIIKERMRRKGLDWQRIVNEMKIHMNMSHRNIVRLYDWCDCGDCLYLVMEYCQFGDMASYMKHRGAALPEKQAVHILCQVVDALDYMHKEHLVVHRDLSLANIFVADCRDGDMLTVKIGDFGLAAQLKSRNDKQMTLCGTVDTMPPEVIQKQPHGLEVDVWALGCILYHVLVGHSAFREDGDNIKQVFHRTLSGKKIKDLDQLSSDARHLLNGMIIRDPMHRFTLSSVRSHPLLTKYRRNDNVSPSYMSVASADSGHGSFRNSAMSGPRSSRSLDRAGRGHLRASPSPPALRPSYRNERFIPSSKPPLPIGPGRRRDSPFNNPVTSPPEPVRVPAYHEETPPGPSYREERSCSERHPLRPREHSICSHSQYCEQEKTCRKCGRNRSIERSRCRSYYESGSCGGRCLRQPSPSGRNADTDQYTAPTSHASFKSEMNRRFDSVSAKRTPCSNDENMPIVQLIPLSTVRLRPAVLKTKRGMFRVLESGDACMEFTREKQGQTLVTEVLQVSADGTSVLHFVPKVQTKLNESSPLVFSASGCLETYSLSALPSKLHKHYTYVAAGVNLFRSRTAKVTVYDSDNRYVFMEDTTFEMTHKDGLVATLKNGTTKLKCVKEGRECHMSQQLNDEFYRMYDHCLSIDAALQPLESAPAATSPVYPLIVGSRRTSAGGTPRRTPRTPSFQPTHTPSLDTPVSTPFADLRSPAVTVTPSGLGNQRTPLSVSNDQPSVSASTRIDKFKCSVRQVQNGFVVAYDTGDTIHVEGSGIIHLTTASGIKKTYSIGGKDSMPRREELPLIIEEWKKMSLVQ